MKDFTTIKELDILLFARDAIIREEEKVENTIRDYEVRKADVPTRYLNKQSRLYSADDELTDRIMELKAIAKSLGNYDEYIRFRPIEKR